MLTKHHAQQQKLKNIGFIIEPIPNFSPKSGHSPEQHKLHEQNYCPLQTGYVNIQGNQIEHQELYATRFWCTESNNPEGNMVKSRLITTTEDLDLVG